MYTYQLLTMAASLVTITSFLLLLTNEWRLSISLLFFQFMGMFLLVAGLWSIPLAVSKLVAGWMSGAMLGIAAASRYKDIGNGSSNRPTWRQRLAIKSLLRITLLQARFFLVFSAIVVILTVFSLKDQVAMAIPGIQEIHSWGGMVLVGMGLVKLIFNSKVFSVLIGLLTALSGFEVLYAAMETSLLVAGMLAIVNLTIAIIGAYLIIAPQMKEFV